MNSPLVIVALAAVLQTGAGAKSAGKVYQSEKGAFSIALPAAPTEQRREAKFGGHRLRLVVVSARRGGTTFSVAHGDFETVPGDDPEKALDAARDEYVASLKGQLLDEQKITLEGKRGGPSYPGRELRVEAGKSLVAGGAVAQARLYLVGQRLYEVAALVPKKRPGTTPADVEKVMTSFRLTGKLPEPYVAGTSSAAKPAAETRAQASPMDGTKTAVQSNPRDPNSKAERAYNPTLKDLLAADEPFEKEYVSKRWGFRTLVPKSWKSDEILETLADNPQAPSGIRISMGGLGLRCEISCREFPVGLPASLLKQLVESLRKDEVPKSAKVISQAPVTVDGVTGEEIVYEPFVFGIPEQPLVKLRRFTRGRRIYSVSYRLQDKSVPSKRGEEFLKGFGFAKEDAEPAHKGGGKEYIAEDWNFRVVFPGDSHPPAVLDQTPTGPQGPKVHVVFVKEGTDTFVITCTPLGTPPAQGEIKNMLAGARDGNVGKGKLIAERRVKKDGLAGLEYDYVPKLPGVPGKPFARSRAFATDKMLYIVGYALADATGPSDRGEAFLDSFRVLKGGTP
jgi:hypothetical protein